MTLFDAKVAPEAVLWCFKDQIKKGVASAMRTWEWPKEVGPTKKERLLELEELDKSIAKLQQTLDDIRGLASGEGVNLLGISKGAKGDEHTTKKARQIAKKRSVDETTGTANDQTRHIYPTKSHRGSTLRGRGLF